MTTSGRVLIGMFTYAATGDAARRQDACVRSLLSLSRADVVNLTFPHDGHHVDGVESLAVLRKDARTVTGKPGRRKGMLGEMFRVLGREAVARGARYFCFTNADIVWSQEAVDWILESGKQGYCFSRRNVDAVTGADQGIELSGIDAFAIEPAWWRLHAHRFRDYIVGEDIWDNTYTAIVMCHADAALENRLGLLRHDLHEAGATRNASYAAYLQYLSALDAGYFRLWCHYWWPLVEGRERGASAAEEERLAREVFVWRPTVASRLVQSARNVKALARYAASRIAVE
jgi:hypothetical protein